MANICVAPESRRNNDKKDTKERGTGKTTLVGSHSKIERERLANSPHFTERTAAGNLFPLPSLPTHFDQLQLPAKQHPNHPPSFAHPPLADVF